MTSQANTLEFLRICGRLKTTKRTGWVRSGVERPESIADHMYRMAILGFLITDPDIDRTRCIKMALAHDIAESLVGDYTPHDPISKEEKFRLEDEACKKLRDLLDGNPAGDEIYALWKEYEDGETKEAKLVKDFDKFEMILQADEYERSQPVNLDDFFGSTKGVFKHEMVQGWDRELREQRQATQETDSSNK